MSSQMDDALAKEAMGLPVFISSTTGTTVTSGNLSDGTNSTNTPISPSFSTYFLSASTFSDSNDSTDGDDKNNSTGLISPKRISKALDSVLTHWETICRQATTMLQEEMNETPSRYTDLESGGHVEQKRFLSEQKGKDGLIEGWLD